jgi:hypothetical protein
MFDFSSPAFLAEIEEMRREQDRLAKKENRQHRALTVTRDKLDELTGALDAYQATPEKIKRAVAIARGEMPIPDRVPPQRQEGIVLTVEAFQRAMRRAKGEL